MTLILKSPFSFKLVLCTFLSWVILAFGGQVLAEEGKLNDDSVVQLQAQVNDGIPRLEALVVDLTQTLTVNERDELTAKLEAFEKQKGSQIAVLIVPTTQPLSIEEYALKVATQWQLGREKTDDGVLLVVAKNDKKMRIEVGYGLEGAIPDIEAKRIVADVIGPEFKLDNFYRGIDAGVERIIALADAESFAELAKAESIWRFNFNDLSPLLVLAHYFPIYLLVLVFASEFFSKSLGRFFGAAALSILLGLIVTYFSNRLSGAIVTLATYFLASVINAPRKSKKRIKTANLTTPISKEQASDSNRGKEPIKKASKKERFLEWLFEGILSGLIELFFSILFGGGRDGSGARESRDSTSGKGGRFGGGGASGSW